MTTEGQPGACKTLWTAKPAPTAEGLVARCVDPGAGKPCLTSLDPTAMEPPPPLPK